MVELGIIHKRDAFEPLVFSAHVWRMSRDREDEVTLVLKIPSTQAIKVISIPTQVSLRVTVEKEN